MGTISRTRAGIAAGMVAVTVALAAPATASAGYCDPPPRTQSELMQMPVAEAQKYNADVFYSQWGICGWKRDIVDRAAGSFVNRLLRGR